jgi:hypothetical protein
MGIISFIKKLFGMDELDPLIQIQIELLKRSIEHHDVEPPLSSTEKLLMEIKMELLKRSLEQRNKDP